VDGFIIIKLLAIVGTILGVAVPLLYLTAIIIAHVVRMHRVPRLPPAIARPRR
jgi:hypothetical protein